MKKIISLVAMLFLFSGFTVKDTWIELTFRGNACCSSELNPVDPFEGGRGPYGAHNLFDNNPATAWVEGIKGYGSGQYFFADLGYALPSKIGIRNGYQKSEIIFKKNSRVKSARITLYVGFHISGEVTEIAELYKAKQIGNGTVAVLKDAMGVQEIALPVDRATAFKERVNLTSEFKNEFKERLDQVIENDPECKTPAELHYFIKFEIIDVYPGSSWDDTGISDFLPMGTVIDPLSSDEIIRKVYEDKEGGLILFDTDIRSSVTLVDMKSLKEYKETSKGVNMAITLMDTSPDNEWAQVDFMFSATGSRVEEYPVLYNVRSFARIGTDILEKTSGMYGFTKKDNKIWLETDRGQIDLEAIRLKLKIKK
jgi:hypothetical protein